MKQSKIKVFYTPKQVNTNNNIIGATSRSPLKPMLLMKALDGLKLSNHFDIEAGFEAFTNEDFRLAHTEKYVNSFFSGEQPLCSSNSLPWSKELADSVRYTSASLYNAVKHAYLNPDQIAFSPTSGFHHAQPHRGSGFCTFSGQVIAAVKMYNEFGVSGAVLDLDGHYGNSIEDTRGYSEVLDLAIPLGFNFGQLRGEDEAYHLNLIHALAKIERAVLANEIGYVMWCHGADSHDEDDLGGQVDTEHWIKCSETFYLWVNRMDKLLAEVGRGPLPVVLSLFGGYRKDNYGSVLSLHLKDLLVCLNTVCGQNAKANIKIAKKSYTNETWIKGMPLSLLRMMYPKQYMTDEEFKATKMTQNEKEVLEFLQKNPNTIFTGNKLGEMVKGWKNHSMGKWATKLIRRGMIVKSTSENDKGYYLAQSVQQAVSNVGADGKLNLID